MKTIILCRGKWEAVTGHSKPIPLKPDGSVDYVDLTNRMKPPRREPVRDWLEKFN